ncbi:MAG TPA: protein kinase [Pirellulales bacterium]|nr:protein kinase [Pirellulales bacterium]
MLDEIASEDSFAVDLRELLPVGPFAGEPELQAALAKAARVDVKPDTLSQNSALEATTGAGRHSSTGPVEVVPTPTQLREYCLLEKLGEGGMGVVYKARHTRLDKIVALKVLSADRLKDADALARFSREMLAVGRLDHPNIVRATDAGEIDGTHFLVMEHVVGKDLSRIAFEHGPLRVADACEAVRQAAIGLQHAHENGLVHRDIKPGNLMLTGSLVKILDLGLARLHAEQELGELTSRSDVVGTVDYMAPEQAANTRSADIRADVYSLGCTLYKLLTGAAPFASAAYPTATSKLLAHANRVPQPVREIRPDVPVRLAAVIEKMLAKAKADRFATPGELADALAPFCRGANLAALLVAPEISNVPFAAVDPITEETLALVESKVETSGRHGGRGRRLVLAAGGLAAMMAAAFVIRVLTDQGELVITSPESEIHATIKRDGQSVKELTLTMGENHVKVRSGNVEVVLMGANAGSFQVTKNEKVTLSRGGSEVVTIERRPADQPQVGSDAITANSPQPVRPPGQAQPPASDTANRRQWPTRHVDREVAERVIKAGGSVSFYGGQQPREAHALSDLPQRPFRILGLNINGCQNLTDVDFELIGQLCYVTDIAADNSWINDDHCRHLQHLRTLERLSVRNTALGDDGFVLLSANKRLIGLNCNNTLVTARGLEAITQACDLEDLSISTAAAAGTKLADLRLPRLRTVIIFGEGFADDSLTGFSKLQQLRSLTFCGALVNGSGLGELAGMKHLHSLSLPGAPLSDAACQTLSGLTSLRYLNLRGTPLTDESVDVLSKLRDLVEIVLDGTRISEDGRARLAASLTRSNLNQDRAKDMTEIANLIVANGGSFETTEPRRSVAAIKDLPQSPFSFSHVWCAPTPTFDDSALGKLCKVASLEFFFVGGTAITDAGLESLAGQARLTHLALDRTKITDEGLLHLSACQDLRHVELTHTQITGRGLAALAHVDGRINLTASAMSYAGLQEVTDLQCHNLTVSRCAKFDDRCAAVIARLGNLQYIDATGCPLSDAGFQELCKLTQLRVLCVEGRQISDAGVADLVRLKELEYLQLHACRLTDSGLATIGDLRHLQELNLIGTGITDGGLPHLAKLVDLHTLRLDATKVTAEGVAKLQAALPDCEIISDVAPPFTFMPTAVAPASSEPLTKPLPPPTDVPAEVSKTLDRQVAEQVLAIGGRVDWFIGLQTGTASTIGELPKELYKVTGIVLEGASDPPETLIAEIGRLHHLRIILANNTRLSNNDLKHIGNLASLTYLQIGFSKVTSEALAALTSLKRLRTLYVGGLGVSDRGAKSIAQLDKLEDLGMPGNRLTDAGLAELAKLRNLRTLDLEGASITDRGLQSLSALTELEELSLRDTRIDGSGLDAIASLPRLRSLSLRGTNVRDEHLGKLGPLSRLHTLDLRGTKITDQAVAALSSIKSLTQIYIDSPAFSIVGREALGAALPQSNLNCDTIAANREAAQWTLKNGGQLTLIANGEYVDSTQPFPGRPFDVSAIVFPTAPAVDDTVLAKFAKLSNLKDLVIPETPAGDSGLMQLGGLKQLMRIDASISKMDDRSLASFADCENLRTLTLRGVQAGRSAIPDFDKLPLESFQFHFGPVSDDFLACLPYQRLSLLVLLGCKNVSDDGVKHLKAGKRLEHLNLIGARMTDTGLAYLAELRHLRELILGSTRISSAGLTSLSGLKELEVLDLSQTLVDTDLSALAGLDRLCWLSFNDTAVGDDGLGHLAHLTDLDHLDLRGTVVTAEEVARLQKALPNCQILTDLR